MLYPSRRLAIVVSITVGVALLAIAGSGVFFQTGVQWFESCWEKSNSAGPLDRDPKPKSASQSIAWAQCGIKAANVFNDIGFVVSPSNVDEANADEVRLWKACPNPWEHIPVKGVYASVVAEIEKMGGPQLVDYFLPADHLIRRAWLSRWPSCSSERKRQGYPKISASGWKGECVPCKGKPVSKMPGMMVP